MLGLTMTNKQQVTPRRDTFRAFLNVRPHYEPNYIWPFSSNLQVLDRVDANKESKAECYLGCYKSIYADDVLIKNRILKRQPTGLTKTNTFTNVFGSPVRGYSKSSTSNADENSDLWTRTTTFENSANIRTRDKERRKKLLEGREPPQPSFDLVDLIMSKAQAVDPNQMETNDSVADRQSVQEELDFEEYAPKVHVDQVRSQQTKKDGNASQEERSENFWFRNHLRK